MKSIPLLILALYALPAAQAAPERLQGLNELRSLVVRPTHDEPLDLLIEGPDVRLYLESFIDFARSQNPKLGATPGAAQAIIDSLLPHLVRVRLKTVGKTLQIQALFDGPFEVHFKKESEAKRLELYGLIVPKFLRFQVRWEEPRIHLERIEDVNQTLALLMKIPLVSDRVYFHRSTFNPETGEVEAQAGVLGDWIQVFARASVYDRKFEGVEKWKTFLWNFAPLVFPVWATKWSLWR